MKITERYSAATTEANAAGEELTRAIKRFERAWEELLVCCADAASRLAPIVELITDEASHE